MNSEIITSYTLTNSEIITISFLLAFAIIGLRYKVAQSKIVTFLIRIASFLVIALSIYSYYLYFTKEMTNYDNSNKKNSYTDEKATLNLELEVIPFKKIPEYAKRTADVFDPIYRIPKLIGRDREMARLQEFLDTTKTMDVMIITGPKGSGKTRLAQELCGYAQEKKWLAGFINEHSFSGFLAQKNSSDWKWERTILIVVDNASNYVNKGLGKWISFLENTNPLPKYPLRLVLIDQSASLKGGWLKQVKDESGFSISEESILNLSASPISDEDRTKIFSEMVTFLGSAMPENIDEITRQLGEADWGNNPRYIMIAAMYWTDASEEQKQTLTLNSLDFSKYVAGIEKELFERAEKSRDLDRYDEALQAIQEAVEIFRALAAKNPNVYMPSLANSLSNLGTALIDLGRYDEALQAIQEAIDIYHTLTVKNSDSSDLATNLDNLKNKLKDFDRYKESLERFSSRSSSIDKMEIYKKRALDGIKIIIIAITIVIAFYSIRRAYFDIIKENPTYINIDGLKIENSNNIKDQEEPEKALILSTSGESIKSFENYIQYIRNALDKDMDHMRKDRAEKSLYKGLAFGIIGMIAFVLTIFLWQFALWDQKEFKTQFAYGIASTALLFISCEFISIWFLTQYQKCISVYDHLTKSKMIFDRYMLAYLAMKDAGESLEHTTEIVKLLREKIWWLESDSKSKFEHELFKEVIEALILCHTKIQK